MADSSERRPTVRTVVEPNADQASARASSGTSAADTPISVTPRSSRPTAPVARIEGAAQEGPRPAVDQMAATEPAREQRVPEEPRPAPRPTVRPAARIAVEAPERADEPQRASGSEGTYEKGAYGERSSSNTSAEVPPSSGGRGFSDMRRSCAGWVHRTFEGHEHAFWGGVIALISAILVFVIGIWRVLFIGIVVVVGIAIGQVFDGDPKLVRAIRDLFDGDRGQR